MKENSGQTISNEYIISKMEILKGLKQKALQLAQHYESNIKIEVNVNIDRHSTAINITEYI